MDQSPSRAAAPRRPRGLLDAVAVLVATGMLALPGCGSAAKATFFQREAVNTPTPDPFTESIGTDQVGVTPSENASGAYAGDIPGLYGGSGNEAVCDPAALVRFLDADPAKATAWAGVLDLTPSEIDAYVARLTPALLRTDTAVTNHGFENGKATSVLSVLQAGTAALVDDRGVPVVKCGCGNPLTAAASTDEATYQGASWEGFTPEQVTTVKPAEDPVTSLVIADPAGAAVRRPVGTTGAQDSPYAPGEGEPGSDDATSTTATVPAVDERATSGRKASDYPLGTGPNAASTVTNEPAVVTTTYVANVAPQTGSPDYPLGVVTDDCLRASFIDDPFTITVRVRDDGVGRGRVTVVSGGGPGGTPVALFSPTPTADLGDAVSPSGTFSAGATRTYDGFYQGEFIARWSGGVARARTRPAEFPLTIRQTWQRDRHFVAWLAGAGGPENFACSYEVTAVRQG